MPSREVEIVNRLGLHLRACAAFVQLAETFPCRVALIGKDGRSNGKSILRVLALGLPKGEKMVIETEGHKAAEALAALAAFVAARFGEPE
jgi:phosphocarrier protein HPr